MLFAFLTIIILVIENDSGDVSLLEFLYDEVSHVVLGFDLV